MYIIFIKNGKINGCGECPCLNEDVINYEVSEELYNAFNENPEMYIYSNGEVIIDPDYAQKEADKREADFKNTFFEIPSFGWFRKVPKGYSSAVESLNTAFNAVSILGQLPADMMIFYTAPDFTDPEQCTEEWLIAHQTKNEAMTAQQFGAFYMAFMTAWNTEMHENIEAE